MYFLLACLTPLYFGALISYRLFFHPLRNYPGPALAAITDSYEAYYNVIKDGALVAKLEALHRQHGPIVRIGPNTLHFNDKHAYHDIYTYGTTLTKEPEFYLGVSAHGTQTSVSFCDPQEAKERRALLGPLFSRKAVMELEYTVQKKIDKLVTVLADNHKSEKSAVAMDVAFRACTIDLITSYCFAESTNVLEVPNFAHYIMPVLQLIFTNVWSQRHFPLISSLANSAPQKLVLWLFPDFRVYAELTGRYERQINRIMKDPDSASTAEHKTVFHHLLDSRDQKPLSQQSLVHEAFTLVGAGTETTASACTVGTYHALKDGSIRQRLFEELRDAWLDADRPMSYAALEKLPYLTAFIKETLRFSIGVIHPLPRVTGPETPMIGGVKIPKGTVVEMSQLFLHMNPDVFPNPYNFNPDRWLVEDTTDMMLDLVPFSKGPRIWCVYFGSVLPMLKCPPVWESRSLAWCELYLIFGNIFRRLDMKLVVTEDTYVSPISIVIDDEGFNLT
ncbi:hypothetical protein D9757_006551 [Collybiopsis confluens]|uniref:Cytochrome P450 n=1 Tax=Collybiopsis confluens TaxID=2823264 RepID=A0A8H5MB75_9AGAR|nr:hypothetical protein D9757_006551 [Collybiopsis confluens]